LNIFIILIPVNRAIDYRHQNFTVYRPLDEKDAAAKVDCHRLPAQSR